MSETNPTPPVVPPTGPVVAGSDPDKDAKTMAILAHLLGIVLGPIGPLIIWMMKKDQLPFVDDQGKEALNFQLTMLIAWFVLFAISLTGILACLSLLLFPVVFVANAVFCVMAAMKANTGVAYRYPFAIRLVK